MKQLEKVQNNTTWAKASNAINNNNDALYVAVTTLEHAAFKNKGYFKSVALLYDAYPTAEDGAQAFVYNSSNPTSAPYDIYEWVNNAWQDSGIDGGSINVNLDSKQDALVGYSEAVSNGKATQVAIQGDAIALSGKVSLGNVDNMESAILMSSSQAGEALAKANTLEQSINALKSPVKPIYLNSQGKLELNIGKGLYVEEGKLCTTGASGGGGGCGTTYSEGQGISIYNDQISVAYNVETLTIDDCGGLSVNYGEGLTIKNGKLSAQTSVNAGNGLVKKGDALQVSVGTGLLVQDDVYVNLGKGLATDNENKVNVNLDEQTLTTDSSGKVIVKKDGLIGNGLKQEYSKLAVNYGTGLTLSNKAIVVNYGTGLSIQDGKLVSTAQGGKTYREGQAIDISGNNEISVKYDGVTISTKDSSDNSLHVMLGGGLKQGTSGIDVVVGSGLAIGVDNQIYCTVGDGIDISNGKISFKLGTSLESKCGDIQVAISSGLEYDQYNDGKIRVKAGDGIIIPNTGEVKAHIGNGLKFGTYGVIEVDNTKFQDKLTFECGLTIVGTTVTIADSITNGIIQNQCDISYLGEKIGNLQPKLTFGSEFMSCNNSVTLNYDVLIPVLAEDGLERKNCGLAIKHGTGLTIDRCGNLSIDHYGIMNPNGGLTYSDGLGVNARDGIKVDACAVVIDYGTGLSLADNKIYVDTSKIAGNGIDLDSYQKKLTIGTKAAQALAGAGLMADGPRMKVKYGSGLTTNSCGELIVDAANLSVKNADMLAGKALGYSNGKVPLYTPFPGFNSLISMGYLKSDYASSGYPINDFLQAICKWAIATYPNTGDILMGSVSPSDRGFLILSMYSAYGYDATSQLPRYCTGWYITLAGKSFRFSTVDYVWLMDEMALLNSTVAKATTANKAIADANGNTITTTYAKQFTPTNGLAINNDRVLYLPNLTSTLAGNAVDESKNGVQRVLNLNCGVIQIKLSTGLAIDDSGYLYIQDKYVNK